MSAEFPEAESRHQRTERAMASLHLAACMSLYPAQDLPACAPHAETARTSAQTLVPNRFGLRASEPQGLIGLVLAVLGTDLASNRSIRTICGTARYFPLAPNNSRDCNLFLRD